MVANNKTFIIISVIVLCTVEEIYTYLPTYLTYDRVSLDFQNENLKF